MRFFWSTDSAFYVVDMPTKKTNSAFGSGVQQQNYNYMLRAVFGGVMFQIKREMLHSFLGKQPISVIILSKVYPPIPQRLIYFGPDGRRPPCMWRTSSPQRGPPTSPLELVGDLRWLEGGCVSAVLCAATGYPLWSEWFGFNQQKQQVRETT